MTWRALFWWRPPCLLESVVVNLRHDATVAYRGVLIASHGAWLRLSNVEALRTAGPPTRMVGDVLVHRSNVAFIQVARDGDHHQ
jgi:hypothetical protein